MGDIGEVENDVYEVENDVYEVEKIIAKKVNRKVFSFYYLYLFLNFPTFPTFPTFTILSNSLIAFLFLKIETNMSIFSFLEQVFYLFLLM